MRCCLGAALALSCSSPDYVTALGTRIYLEPGASWDWAQVEHQEQSFIEASTFSMEEARTALSELDVYVHAEVLPCDWLRPGATCSGWQQGAEVHVVAYRCVHESAFTHEEAHWLQERLLGWIDRRHEAVPLWKIADAQYGQCR
jgi:hypothetical protein